MSQENTLAARYLAVKRKLFEIYYSSLNAPQREAVFTANGSLLVLAGAGSGKTTVLVRRIVYLIKYGNAYYSDYVPHDITETAVAALERDAKILTSAEVEPLLYMFASDPCRPWQMLAITFTNKAANEIKTRLASAMGSEEDAAHIWAGTFHSVCMRILRSYGELLGYRPNFTVYDTDDSKKTISSCMKDLNIDEKALPVKSVMSEISRAKDNLLTPADYAAECGNDFRRQQIAKIYRAYAERMKASNALDFDDIIMQTVFLLREHEDVRDTYQRKFRYVSVDEFQDTNHAQFELTALLCGGHKNVMVVGDDDQSIYKFRGAVIENILGFEGKFKGTKVIKLEQNYRSTSVILDAANAVIAKNIGRKGKSLWTRKQGGAKITLKLCEEQNSEARYLVDKISEAVRKGEREFRDCAILYRTNAQSNIIERTFAKSGIPYRMLGGLRFNDRKEIKDVVAYLQFIVNPDDAERMRRIINEPRRGIGAQTVDGIIALARENGMSVFEVMKNADRFLALSRAASKLKAFASLIGSLAELLRTSDITLEAFVKEVLLKTGYRQMLIDGGEEEKERLENLDEFVSGVIEYESANDDATLVGFLEENALVSDVDRYDETADAVVMMTIHSAKGLEFPVVFLPGMEDGLFPGMQSVMGGEAELEEERRLAYVAITRAKEKLYITHTKNRMLYGRTSYNPISRFVTEIPEVCIDKEKPPVRSFSDMPKTYIGGTSDKPEYPKSTKQSSAFTPYTPAKKAQPSGNVSLKAGDRVSHITFGEGEILSAKPMGADVLYEVVFDKVGTKKLMGTYARLKKIQ